MPNQKKNISLKKEISINYQPEDNENQVQILLQAEVPLVSNCSCYQPLENLESSNKRVEFTVLHTSSVQTQSRNPFPMTNSSNSSCCSDDAGLCEIPDQDLNDIQELTGNILEYRIEGMDCPVCAQTIEKSLAKLQGIKNVIGLSLLQINWSSRVSFRNNVHGIDLNRGI